MKKFILIALLLILAGAYLFQMLNKSRDANEYSERIILLQKDNLLMAGLVDSLELKIEDKEKLIEAKSYEIANLETNRANIVKNYNRIFRELTKEQAIEIIPKDTMELATILIECERDRELWDQDKKEIKLLRSKSIVQAEVINDQAQIIESLKEQIINLEHIAEFKDQQAAIEIRKLRRQRNIVLIGAGAIALVAIL